jgi:hypothetical protein
MPGDPKQCREHAKRCWVLASEITNPVLKESLSEAAQRWAVLAAELETIHSLLEALEETEKKTLGQQRATFLNWMERPGAHERSSRPRCRPGTI